jgi:hypothetical protein
MIAARPKEREPPTRAMGIPQFERFFRAAAGLDVDKQDLKRYSDFVNRKLYDLLVRGEEVAQLNGKPAIRPLDLPITKGLQACIDAFAALDEEIELKPILEYLTLQPPLGRPLSEEAQGELPGIVGGLSVSLARTFKIVDPTLKNPQSEHWERAFRVFDLLL